MLELDRVYNEDCIEGMKKIADKSIDLILCDLPYGTTACKWDSIIPFEDLWEQYNRIIKDDGNIVLFGAEPFSTLLRASNLEMYRYDWVWDKNNASNYPLAKKQPLKVTENIMVFYKKLGVYNPQGIVPYGKMKTRGSTAKHFGENSTLATENLQEYTNYPKNILSYTKTITDKALHPTQKPTALLSYLIETYTKGGGLVLDNCMGSFSTAISCLHTKRHFIGFELDKEYFKCGNDRIQHYLKMRKLEAIADIYK